MTDRDAWEHQRRTFERTAEEYERRRPGYPDALFEDLKAYAALGPDERILEIGCGPGKATTSIARWGNPMLCLEPSQGMVDVARANLAGFPNVGFQTTTFEAWQLEPEGFGLVSVAQAFHWLDPDTRTSRIAAALRPGGTVALIDNVQVTPAEHLPFFVRVQEVYREHTPALAHKGEFRREAPEGHMLRDANEFVDLQRYQYPWEWTLGSDEYVALMATHSPHAALPGEVRRRLLSGIAELIDGEFGSRVTENYVALLQVGRRA